MKRTLRSAQNRSVVREVSANARLIAAAPELLASLKAVLEYMPSVTAFQRERIRLAEAAIAKAEGK